MPIKTTVGQIASAGGRPLPRPDNTLVEERPPRLSRGRGRDRLYILAEVQGPAAERDTIGRRLLQTVRDAYYEGRGSVTAGLQQALQRANSLLFEENRNALPGERWTAALNCAVLRDDDLFIAQVGPAVAYLRGEKGVMRIPSEPLPPEEVPPLGERRDPAINLFHHRVGVNDTLLLVDGNSARSISPQVWFTILSEHRVDDILHGLATAGQGNDLSALVVRLEGEPATAAGPSPSHPPPPVKASGPWMENLHLGERLRGAGAALPALLAGLGAGFLALLKRMVPSRSEGEAAAGRPVRKPAKRPRSGYGATQKALAGIAVIIPIAVAVLVVVTIISRGHKQRVEVETLWQQAQEGWQQAQSTTDPATVRARLNEAAAALDQLLAVQPDHAEAAELRKRVIIRLDEINRVRRVIRIAELNTYPDNAELSRVVVEGTHIFVLDRRNGLVYHHRLADPPQTLQPDTRQTVLLRKGDQINGVVVGDLVDMVWMPAGNGRQKANLVILESGGALLEYDPTTEQLRALRLAAVETWQFPRLVGSYYGRFYLLDEAANKIWRYSPTVDGYSSPPDDWLQQPVDLTGVVDMAIGNSIYLLYADGKMRKLTTGLPDTFDISDWDVPPRTPTALFTRPPEETKWLYTADRGNGRIVQSGKDGQFQRQFRMADTRISEGNDPLAGVTSLFVDEIGGLAYILSQQRLYLLTLPD